MPTKKNNLENIWRNLVSNPSCRGQNKTIMSTRLSRFNTVYCACSFNILTQYKFAFQVFRLILNVILHMEYGAVRVKWHHFWIQHTLIYLKTSLALVWLWSIQSTCFYFSTKKFFCKITAFIWNSGIHRHFDLYCSPQEKRTFLKSYVLRA